jgi:hypothetical protein
MLGQDCITTGCRGADGYEDTRTGWLGGDLYYYYLAASDLCW